MKISFTKIIDNEYAYSVFTKVIGVLAGLIYSILYSRYLGTELRGEAAVITNLSSLLSLATCLGMYQAYPFYIKQSPEKKEELYTGFINKVLGLFFLLSALIVILFIFHPFSLNNIVALILTPMMMCNKQLYYVILIENPKLRNTASLLMYLAEIVLIGFLMLFTEGNYFYCCLFLIIKEVIALYVALKNTKLDIRIIRPTLQGVFPYIKYGILPMLTVILMEVNYKIDILMLDGYVSPSEIGIYSLGVQIGERLWLVPDALKDTLLSKLTKGKGKNEVTKITRISFFVMLICVIPAAAFGKPFIRTLYGEEYLGAYSIMLVILASVVFMVFYKMVYAYNVANGMKRINFVILATAALINVLINFIMIPIYGSMGAAVASLISYSSCGFAFLGYFVWKNKIPLSEMVLLKNEDLKLIKNLFRTRKQHTL